MQDKKIHQKGNRLILEFTHFRLRALLSVMLKCILGTTTWAKGNVKKQHDRGKVLAWCVGQIGSGRILPWRVTPNCECWDLTTTAEVFLPKNNRTGRKSGDSMSESLSAGGCVQTKGKPLVFTSPSGAFGPPLCCNWRLFSERWAHTWAVNGKDLEEDRFWSGALRSCRDVKLWCRVRGRSILWKEKVSAFGGVGSRFKVFRVWTTLRVIRFCPWCVVGCWLTRVRLACWEKHRFW